MKQKLTSVNKKKIYFDFLQLSAIVFYMQIPKTKYKQGIKLFHDHKVKNGIVNLKILNADLRRIGYSKNEIDSFWTSSIEFRNLIECHKHEEKQRYKDWESACGPSSHYEDEIDFHTKMFKDDIERDIVDSHNYRLSDDMG